MNPVGIEPRAELNTGEQLIRIAELAQRIKELELQLAVAKFRQQQDSKLTAILVSVVGRIVEMSKRLFPGEVSVEYSCDPENPTDECVVFNVVAGGEYADYRDRQIQWHNEVRKIAPGTLGEFRLSVAPPR